MTRNRQNRQNRLDRLDRRGSVPRSVLVLLGLLALAVGALMLTRQKNATPDYTLGGALFPVAVEDIEGLLLTRQEGQYRLNRLDTGYWGLSGAVTDLTDSLSVLRLLDQVTRAGGGPLLPGTEVEDRRYEFNGPEAVRLTVFVTGADPISLVVGTGNPVAGNFYASGAGREACFMVAAAFAKNLLDFPGSIQARTLLPGVDRDAVERIDLKRGERAFLLERRDDRWWLLMPPEGPAYLGPEVVAYQAMYQDRRAVDGTGTWILASTEAVEQLIYEVTDVIVRDIKSPAESLARLVDLDLDPPWRKVTLTGPELNPDPSTGPADQVAIAFGPALSVDAVPALRLGNVLVTDMEAINLLEKPLGMLAHRTALTWQPLKADVITLERESRLILRGTRTGVAATREGREAWLTEIPRADQTQADETLRQGFTRDLVVNLGRVEILAVLPPTSDPAVLEDRERVRISVTFGLGEEARTEVVEMGYLNEALLPPGSPPLVREDPGAPVVGLWFPGDGRLLQVPDQFIVTARNLGQMVSD